MKQWYQWMALEYFFKRSAPYGAYCLIGGMIVMVTAVLWGGFLTPPDVQQGEAYRMIYMHVPCAAGGMVVYAGISIAALIHWVWRIKLADVCMTAFVPVGAVLTALALGSGSIWGRPMWGTWWVWDARLTSCLILLCLYLGLMALRQSISDGTQAARVCAWVTLIGALDLPIIHYSVNWWNTLHQPATMLAFKAPSMDASMLWPLLLSLFGMALWCIGLGLIRMRTLIIMRYRHLSWVQRYLGGIDAAC